MLKTKLEKLFLKKRGISPVISTTILAGAVIALGFVVFMWTYNRTLAFNVEYANVVETDLARIKEKLVFEFVFYNTSNKELTVYMMNCGKSNNVSLTNAFLSNSSWYNELQDQLSKKFTKKKQILNVLSSKFNDLVEDLGIIHWGFQAFFQSSS